MNHWGFRQAAHRMKEQILFFFFFFPKQKDFYRVQKPFLFWNDGFYKNTEKGLSAKKLFMQSRNHK